MSRVLLIAPTYMNLYEDIVSGLQAKGYEVQYYPDKRIKGNPFNKVGGGDKKIPVEEFMVQLDTMWTEILAKDQYNCFYDYLLVIDGLSVAPLLFDRLRKANPNIVACNYLYDRVNGVYELDHNFPYYDRVFSFDQKDCADYNLSFLPIYWTPIEKCKHNKFDVFGFGGYDKTRLKVFKHIRNLASKEKLTSFIHIFIHYDNRFILLLKIFIKAILGQKHVSALDVLSGIYTNKTISPTEFRKIIASSKVIIDTNHPYQDGLTARFMWALGAEKKIVTTNQSVQNYSFYSKEQFFIINNNWQELFDFIKRDYSMPNSIREEVLKFRIDNWLDVILLKTDRL